ncbi:hypothetical protein OXPF_14690 [Oxobacter pfennigii]|uniref:TIGR04086 family membrane protein n=1 Tax=Oxobacter pfennigii TaxID=36849 RepID=A0A0P8WB97_9CLOT|nr:TIGR04086 family membrane protein [Oxobacter pfennigii]KPU44991.1 hypothetical protein OXPF_14690 [Oxobacter pfennigii]
MSIGSLTNFNNEKGSNRIVVIGKSILIAYIISIVFLLIYGVLLTLTNISETTLPTAVMVITLVSIALSGIYSAVKSESKGWLNGALVGILYMLILFMLGMLFKTGILIDNLILFRIFMGFVIGSLAGIIGINLK